MAPRVDPTLDFHTDLHHIRRFRARLEEKKAQFPIRLHGPLCAATDFVIGIMMITFDPDDPTAYVHKKLKRIVDAVEAMKNKTSDGPPEG